jgi:hypothetical protein
MASDTNLSGEDKSAQASAVAAAKEAASSPPAPAATPKVAVGDTIHLVHHRRGIVKAEVTKVHKGAGGGGCFVDLETDDETPIKITRSPYDATGKKPDSWHPAGK